VSAEKFLTYRGEIEAVVGVAGTLAFVTAHPEGQATGLYWLDADTLGLDVAPLPQGGGALAVEGDTVWVAGTDLRLYAAALGDTSPKPLGPALATMAAALVPLADARLAALAGSRVLILTRANGTVLQELELPESGTCLAADPTGRWLAAGTSEGTVAVFSAEGRPEFALSASERLHEGAVSAILFELDELRFFSAGADQKLLSTHARGRLEPEDKGRGNNHTDLVTALVWGPGDRLYSGSRDGSIKSWPRVGGVKPATTKEGLGPVVALAVVTVHDRPRLAAACVDNGLRLFTLDAAGKIGEISSRIHDAYALARNELAQSDPGRREVALKLLAGYADATAVELIAAQAREDADHVLRLQAAVLLGASPNPRAATALEGLLSHGDEAVRVAAFRGLRTHRGEASLAPIELALKAEKPDIGRLAIDALAPLAQRDEQALARLNAALNAKTREVRHASVLALESVHGVKAPDANLSALGSKHADVRRLALLRLYRRGLLESGGVGPALGRRLEDEDAEVRRVAFLLAVCTRERLIKALRGLDTELDRQFVELETAAAGTDPGIAGVAVAESSTPKRTREGGHRGVADSATATQPRSGAGAVQDTDLEPLLQATASRALDTSLRGARGLAILRDPRALGMLLQLSREEDRSARAWVCRLLGWLQDPRSLERVRSLLHDGEAEVRDAAYTALVKLQSSMPLVAAESGLNAPEVDVRRRGLETLTAELRRDPASEPARELLTRALNDGAPDVRAEAFKTALGTLAKPLGPAGALRFAARSVHADVRREALNEVMAQVAEAWGWDLLLEFFNDADPALRAEAFTFAAKKTRGLEILDAALGSRYADLRKRAVDALVQKHTAPAQALLLRALEDEDRNVRLEALEALIAADTRPALTQALGSARADVRLRAAKALARHGDTKALAPLIALATAPEPEEPERKKDWLKLAESALDGLGELGDPAALVHLVPALDSPHADLRKQAARALAWVSRPGKIDALRQALQHADPEVKYRSALGLAYAGDVSVASLVFSEPAAKILSVGERLAAALALGDAGEERLIVALDDASVQARNRAFLLLMVREWKDPRGNAARALACLSSRCARLRLKAALGIESCSDPTAFGAYVGGLVNERDDKPAWTIPAATVDDLATLLVHAEPQLRAHTARLLKHLQADEPEEFLQAWAVHAERFATVFQALRKKPQRVSKAGAALKGLWKAITSDAAADLTGPQQLLELAFGAYVGLAREQGGPAGLKDPAAGAQAARVRQTAQSRLLALAQADTRRAAATRPVFLQALGDPNQAVRLQAFEYAQAVGVPTTTLAAEALATGHTDLGIKGLELLTGGASEAEAQAVLERAMLTRNDNLAIESAKLLIGRRGAVVVASAALEAAHEPLRNQAIGWLAAEDEKDPKARDALRAALGSRYRAVREGAAYALADKKDPAAFDALANILLSAKLPAPQTRVAKALLAIGDPRGPDVLLDRIENDPAGTAKIDTLLDAVGNFRRPETVARLLGFWDKLAEKREEIFKALFLISGHDQSIEDPGDEGSDDRWLERQHPRRDDVLARLIERVSRPTEAKFLTRLLPAARWARSREVDAALSGLVNHPNELVRRDLVRALGWRLRERNGVPEPLRKALAHRDPVTQFLAAEGLARARFADGLNVLLASIDFASDLEVRRGAVAALGIIADERALDVLLKLAGEYGHALQEAALEAIGHFTRSPRAAEVFQLLERVARGEGPIAHAALEGLRWFDSPAGWTFVRRHAWEFSCPNRSHAIRLLGYNDEPATRDLLLRVLAGDTDSSAFDLLVDAMTSARRLWGRDSLEPDYAALRNSFSEQYLASEYGEILERVRSRGESGRIFALLPHCGGEEQNALVTGLLRRPELPVAEAISVLDSPDPTTVRVAARILGHAGTRAGQAATAIEAALVSWRRAWDKQSRGFHADTRADQPSSVALQECLRSLVWAAGRIGTARTVLVDIARMPNMESEFQPVRLEAVLALAGEPSPESLAALEAAMRSGAPDVRAAAAQALRRHDPARAATLAPSALSDRVSFDRLTHDGSKQAEETLLTAVRQVHYQGVVLPALIARQDVPTLTAVAEDGKLPETARLGAVEGLAAMGLVAAEDVLRRIGTRKGEDEEFRKAALRGLKRSKRLRQKAATEVRS
jgi:ParB family chromosome partitioning protein